MLQRTEVLPSSTSDAGFAFSQTTCVELFVISVPCWHCLAAFPFPQGFHILEELSVGLFLLLSEAAAKYWQCCFELPSHENTLCKFCMV